MRHTIGFSPILGRIGRVRYACCSSSLSLFSLYHWTRLWKCLLRILMQKMDKPMFDPRRLYDPRDVLMICSSLVTLTALQEYRFYNSDEETGIEHAFESLSGTQVIILAQFSVREYLTSYHLRMRGAKMSFYHFDKGLADTSIGKTCLAYLLEFDKDWATRTAPQPSALSDYAARSWMRHAQLGGGNSDTLHRLIMSLFESVCQLAVDASPNVDSNEPRRMRGRLFITCRWRG